MVIVGMVTATLIRIVDGIVNSTLNFMIHIMSQVLIINMTQDICGSSVMTTNFLKTISLNNVM